MFVHITLDEHSAIDFHSITQITSLEIYTQGENHKRNTKFDFNLVHFSVLELSTIDLPKMNILVSAQ